MRSAHLDTNETLGGHFLLSSGRRQISCPKIFSSISDHFPNMPKAATPNIDTNKIFVFLLTGFVSPKKSLCPKLYLIQYVPHENIREKSTTHLFTFHLFGSASLSCLTVLSQYIKILKILSLFVAFLIQGFPQQLLLGGLVGSSDNI